MSSSQTHPSYPKATARCVPEIGLTVVAGPDCGRSLRLHKARLLIGRGETCDLRLSDPTVSLCHLELRATEAGIELSDLGSRNGVMIGQILLGSATLRDAAVVRLGDTQLRIEPLSQEPLPAVADFAGLIGESPAMRELYASLRRLCQTDLSIIIQGETGCGKEAVARALHAHSPRAAAPFVVLDCTAIPPTLAQSLLFGHSKGAFTGASEARVGVFEAAHSGVLFLDEIGELPQDLQPLLLRVLQQHEVVPLGASRARPVDVRVICATWRDLREMVNRGQFREDLYYRLAQSMVWVPPLREHKDDIPLLTAHFLGQPHKGATAHAISSEALDVLSSRPFPGNVRELQNLIERLAFLADGPQIELSDLVSDQRRDQGRERATPRRGQVVPFKVAKQTAIENFEHSYLVALLHEAQGNLSLAANLAGLERHNLRDLLRKRGLYRRQEDTQPPRPVADRDDQDGS